MSNTTRITTAAGYTWQEVALDRQAYRNAAVAQLSPPLPTLTSIPQNTLPLAKEHLTEEELCITESKVEELLPKLASGQWSALKVAAAFLRRAGLAGIATNCLTELLPHRALTRAAYLDNYLAEHGRPIGPLHGLPISVKEHMGMKGLDHNAGFIAWVGRTAMEDGLILKILEGAGTVFTARTTQPQSLMHLETAGNIYGTTVNPFNTTLTAGGSSGGEGALIGFRGSCLGIGTDIGGSIRSPAANNGLYGIKPTTGRLPVTGWTATMAGAEQIVPTIGPLSTSLEGCNLFMKTIIDAKPWLHEPSLLPFPWRDEVDYFIGRKLKVAVLWDDEVVMPHPPVTRALKRVVEKLKASLNVEIVEWKPWKHDLAWEIIASLYFSDGAAEELAAMAASNEPLMPLTKHILLPPSLGGGNPHVQEHTISSLWSAVQKRDAYRVAYAELWNATATSPGEEVDEDGKADIGRLHGMVDVILSPVGPGAAPKLETSKWWGYTSQWNLLDYPAVVFPVDRVGLGKSGDGKEIREGEKEKDEVDREYERHEVRGERDRENVELWRQFGEEGWRGAPVCLQVVGRRYEDEKVIQALDIIEREAGSPFASYV